MSSEGITTTAAAAAAREPDEALWKFSTTLRVTPLQRHITPFPPPALFPSQHNLSPRSDASRRLSAAETLKRADLTEARHQSRDSVHGELFPERRQTLHPAFCGFKDVSEVCPRTDAIRWFHTHLICSSDTFS